MRAGTLIALSVEQTTHTHTQHRHLFMLPGPPRLPFAVDCVVILLTLFLCSCVPQMFLTVYLSNNDQHFTEVPITPETLCRDVVELCKEPGEMDCHLSEMWRGSGEPVLPAVTEMYSIWRPWNE